MGCNDMKMLYSLSKLSRCCCNRLALASAEVLCALHSDQGLEKEPTNTALKSGLESVKKAMDSNSPFGAGEDPMGSMFSDPNLLGKLASNPRTSKFMADPSFVQKIKDLQNGKSKADMANILQDQRMLAVLGVAMGVDMVSANPIDDSVWEFRLISSDPLYSKHSSDQKALTRCPRV